MGKGDRCGVGGCDNDRRFSDRIIKRSHVEIMQWFG